MGDLKKPSVEALREMRGAHQDKLARAELEKEAHIQKMLEELEGLMFEREQNEQLLYEAQATLSYYVGMGKNGKLDEEDLKNSANVEGLVSDLEEQKWIINTSITEIKTNPDVAKKLKEKAEAELKIREAEKITKQAELKEKLRKEFTALAENIRALGEKKYLLDKQIKEADGAEIEAREKKFELPLPDLIKIPEIVRLIQEGTITESHAREQLLAMAEILKNGWQEKYKLGEIEITFSLS